MNQLAEVNKGEPITRRHWDSIGGALRSVRPVAGVGVRTRQTASGTIISATQSKERHAIAFRASLRGNTISIGPGLLNGTERDGPSDLQINLGEKTLWVVISADLPKWSLKLSTTPTSKGIHPIAFLDRRNGAKLYQLTHFNLQTIENGQSIYFIPQ
jgi:hypothetical protein